MEGGVYPEPTRRHDGSRVHALFCSSMFLASPVVQQRANVVSNPNGSRIISSEEPGGSSRQQILTPPELAHEVVISPGLPTPPLSPFGSARMSYGGVKVCTEAGYTLHEVEGTELSKQVLLPVDKICNTSFRSIHGLFNFREII